MSFLRRIEQGQGSEPALDWLSREHFEFATEVARMGIPVVWYDENVWGSLAKAEKNQPTYCGDGRKEKGKVWKKATRSLKMFGGILMPTIYEAKIDSRSRINYQDVENAKSSGESVGINLGGHDLMYEEWVKVHCGFGKKLADGSLGFSFDRGVTPSGVVEIFGQENHVDLKGDHVEKGWLMNYRKGHTRVPDTQLFHTDFEALDRLLAYRAEEASVMSARVVKLLKPDAAVLYVAK